MEMSAWRQVRDICRQLAFLMIKALTFFWIISDFQPQPSSLRELSAEVRTV
jgi:hypothetical protein